MKTVTINLSAYVKVDHGKPENEDEVYKIIDAAIETLTKALDGAGIEFQIIDEYDSLDNEEIISD